MYLLILLLLIIIHISLFQLSLSRKVIITGGTGVLGNAIVKVLSTSSSIPTSIYVGYRDIKKLEKLYENESILLKYFNSNSNSDSNSIKIFPTYINLDDEDIDVSFLDDNKNDSNEIILINNAAVFMNGNDHNVMIKSLKYNCIKPGILIITHFIY